jgi:IS1 family transposase
VTRCAELHDRMMVGLRVGRIETDELWAYVGKKQKQVTRADSPVKGDQYTFIALASSAKAIIAYHTGKRDSDNCDRFIRDLRDRVLGAPEISTDGYTPYLTAIRDAFGNRVAHGIVTKTYSVTHLIQQTKRDAETTPALTAAVLPQSQRSQPQRRQDKQGLVRLKRRHLRSHRQ